MRAIVRSPQLVAVLAISFLFILLPQEARAQNDPALESYHFAARLFEKGFFERAARENEKFLEKNEDHPKAPLARWRLSQSLYNLRQFEDASKSLDQLMQMSEAFEYAKEADFRRQQCRFELGDFKGALEGFDRIWESIGDHYLATPTRFFQAESAFKVNNLELALDAYRDVMAAEKEGPYARPAFYGHAWTLYRQERWDEADKALENFIEQYPEDESRQEVLFLRGECGRKQANFKGAVALYDLVADGEYADEALLASGFATADAGDHLEAAARFARLIRTMDNSPLVDEAALQHGVELVRGGEHQRARDHLKPLLARNDFERKPEAAYWLGLAHSKLGETELALMALDRSVAESESEELASRGKVARGDALFDAGRFDEAAKSYEGGAAEGTYAARAKILALINAGDFETALAESQQVLASTLVNSERAEVLMVQGEAFFGLEGYREAEDAFAKVKGLDGSESYMPRCDSRIGWCRFYRDDFQGAAKAFSDSLTLEPEGSLAPEASLMRGRSLLSAGDFKGAVKSLQDHTSRFAETEFGDDGLYYLARALSESDEAVSSVQTYQALLNRFPGSDLVDRAYFEVASLYEEAKDPKQAVEWFEKLVNSVPESELVPRAIYQSAWCRFESDEFASAASSAVRVAAHKTADPELVASSLELAVEAYRKAGDSQGAVQSYRTFVEIFGSDPRSAEIGMRSALSMRENGDLEGAGKLLSLLARGMPDSEIAPRILLELGFVSVDSGDKNTGASAFGQVISRHQDHPLAKESSFQLGEIAYGDADFKTATTRYEWALENVEDKDLEARALYKLGWSRMSSGEHAKASSAFQRLPVSCPESGLVGESIFLSGEAYFRGDRYEDALGFFERIREDHADHDVAAKSVLREGICLANLKRWSEARNTLSRLRRDVADFPEAAERDLWLGRSLAALGEGDLARDMFAHVISSNRADLSVRARIETGRVYMTNNDPENALAEFLKVALLSDRDEEIAEGLFLSGQCLEQTREIAKAQAQYLEIVERFPESEFGGQSQAKLRAMKDAEDV